MLQAVLEKVLLKYIEPFVDDFSGDQLRLGIVSGSLQLRDIRVKPAFLVALGVETLHARSGCVGLIDISVPWSSLYTGKVRLIVDRVHLELEQRRSLAQDVDLVRGLRNQKQQELEAQTTRLRAQLTASAGGSDDDAGVFMRLGRNVLNNSIVGITNVHVSLANRHDPAHGHALAVEARELAVLSTDETFSARAMSEGAVAPGHAMYKLLRLRGLGLRALVDGPDGRCASNDYVLRPVSFSLRIADVQSQQFLHVRMEVGTEERAEAAFRRSVLQRVWAAHVASNAEGARLRQLMVPPEIESALLNNATTVGERYERLFERQLLQRWGIVEDGEDCLSNKEKRWLEVVEDALPTCFIAQRRLAACECAEQLRAVEERRRASFLSRLSQRFLADAADSLPRQGSPSADRWFTPEELQQLRMDVRGTFQAIDPPKRFSIEFVFGHCELSLLDDRWPHLEEERIRFLRLALRACELKGSVTRGTDQLGQSSLQWRLQSGLGAFQAWYATQTVLRLAPSPSECECTGASGAAQHALSLLLASGLGVESNMVRLRVESKPLEVSVLPGMVGQLLAFYTDLSQEVEPYDPGLSAGLPSRHLSGNPNGTSATFENSKWTAVDVVPRQMYEQIPSQFHLDVKISAPIVHVPVAGHGTAIFSLGEMQLATPEPCTFDRIDLAIDLTRTIVRTVPAPDGDSFEIVEPVPVRILICYEDTADETSVDVRVTTDELLLRLAPQALQLLYSACIVASSLMSETGPGKTADSPSRSPSELTTSTDVELSFVGSSPAEVAMREAKASSFSLALHIGTLTVAVQEQDSVVPIARLRVELLPPGLALQNTGQPSALTLDVESCRLFVEMVNERSGRWEPLLEKFQMGLWITRRSRLGDDDAGDGDNATTDEMCVCVNGHQPLLLNVTPPAVRMLSRVVPLILASLDPLQEDSNTLLPLDVVPSDKTVRYRAVNVSGCPIEILFKSNHTEGLATRVDPSGSIWISLDEFVLQHYATAVTVRTLGGVPSEELSLERAGAVSVPGTGALAELLVPRGSYHLLLFASPLRVHNQTDLPLFVRARGLGVSATSPMDLQPSMVCVGELLGHATPTHESSCQYGDIVQTDSAPDWRSVLLPPNSVLAVPRSQDESLLPLRAWLSVRPAGLHVGYSAEIEVGEDRSFVMACRGVVVSGSGAGSFTSGSMQRSRSAPRPPPTALPSSGSSCGPSPRPSRGPSPGPPPGPSSSLGQSLGPTPGPLQSPFRVAEGVKERGCCLLACAHLAGKTSEPQPFGHVAESAPGHDAWNPNDVHLLCEPLARVSFSPSRLKLLAAVLRPTLAFLNALPNRSLTIRYSLGCTYRDSSGDLVERTGVAQVPRLTRLNLYNRPVAPHKGLRVSVRLEDGAPWSCLATLPSLEALGAAEAIPLWERHDGSAASVNVEPLGHSEVRFSCPIWFVERCGPSLSLALCKGLSPLPCRSGITLLPADAFEDMLTVALKTQDGSTSHHNLQMSPNWSELAWDTSIGRLVLCAQTEDVALHDVLGAHCQVVTLRPRIVVTNASPWPVELNAPMTSRTLQLEVGQSHAWHGAAELEGEDVLTCRLRFRPHGQRQCGWSGVVVCSDAAAGATALAVPAADYLDVWTVEIAPVHGALAVTLRQGSTFVAAHCALRRRGVHMGVRPHGSSPTTGVIDVQPGRRVPYGWPRPFDERNASHAVHVLINGEEAFEVSDVRRTMRQRSRLLGLVLVVTRVGEETALELHDIEALPMDDHSLATSWFQVDVKLSQLGVSIVTEEAPARELFFVRFHLIRLQLTSNDGDMQQFALSVSEVQVDCQLPGRVDGNRWQRPTEALGLAHWDLPAVVLANCAVGDQPCLSLLLRRMATSHDVFFPRCEFALDSLDVTIDSAWLDHFVTWLNQAYSDGMPGQGASLTCVVATAGKPITEGYAPPSLPSVLQVEDLLVSPLRINIWCALCLQSFDFLPAYVRTAVRVLSVGHEFTVDGASLRLPNKHLPYHRGSLDNFFQQLLGEYMAATLSLAARVLGKSSLLKVPRVVFRSGSTMLSMVSGGIGLATGEAVKRLTWLTFDKKYIAQQRRNRNDKAIDNFGDGIVEAGRSLAQGVEGMLDVVRLPVRGARKNGLQGFVAGVGKGFAGSFVKPVMKFGEAISDVTIGVSAQTAPQSVSTKRHRAHIRQRRPRLLFSDVGVIRPWSAMEAEVLQQLGSDVCAGVEEVMHLTLGSDKRTLLLLFPWRLVLANVSTPYGAAAPNENAGFLGLRRLSILGTSPSRFFKRRHRSLGQDEPLPRLPSSPSLRHANSRGSLDEFMEAAPTQTLDLSAFSRLFQPIAGIADAREFRLCALRSARIASDGWLVLEGEAGHSQALHMPYSAVSEAVREALLDGLRSSISHPLRLANWTGLHAALLDDTMACSASPFCYTLSGGVGSTRRGVGYRILEVFEVERRKPPFGRWRTPFYPFDHELTWRWVDAAGQRHPQLQLGLGRQACASRTEPPCEPKSGLFEAASQWEYDLHEGTDADGWCYSLAWNSSVWDAKPGLLDAVRKRRWTRKFV